MTSALEDSVKYLKDASRYTIVATPGNTWAKVMRILLTSFMVERMRSRSTRTSWARPFSPITTMLDFLPSAQQHVCKLQKGLLG